MTELIKIEEKDGRSVVSGRQLYNGLQITTPYTIWFKRMCEYGFEDQKDFITILLQSTGGRPMEDHALTLDMAKEISMIQRNDLGKMFRQYFIQCEKQLLQVSEKDRLLIGLFSKDPMTVKTSYENLIQLETKPLLEEIQTKTTQIDTLIPDSKNYAISDVGRILKPYSKVMGAKGIFSYMRTQKILFDEPYTGRHNMPYSQYSKYFVTKIVDSQGKNFTKTYFTGKGLKWFLDKLVKEQIITSFNSERAKEYFKEN